MKRACLITIGLAIVCWGPNPGAAQDLEVKGVDVAPEAMPTQLGPAGSPQLQVEGKNVITEEAFVLSASIAHSRDDLSWLHDWAQLIGDDEFAVVTMPFSVQLEGVSYNTISISTNGWIAFGAAVFFSDLSNRCLPTYSAGSAYLDPGTYPFVAALWDDLVTQGAHVQYGWVGLEPNRTFVVDWETHPWAYPDSLAIFQAQIHETSNLINVKYWDLAYPAVGLHATIGFQGAGGTAAQAYPLTCNGQILDDNNPVPGHDAWSIAPVR